MNKETTNAVRQILMNELGLSRAAVRAEMTQIIAAECEKAVTVLVTQGALEELVRCEFRKLVSNGNGWSSSSIAYIVKMAAEKVAKEYVQNNIQFSCKENKE